VDVITVTYRSARHVGGCIGSVLRSPLVESVVVVDNASGDGSPIAARDAGARVVVANDENVGFARAVNQGLEHTTASRVLLLNPDARLEPAALGRLEALFTADPRVAIVAPLLRDERGRLRAGAGRAATVARRVGLCVPLVGRAPAFRPEYGLPSCEDPPRAVAEAGYVFGAAMLVDRRFLEEAGGFDERFFLFAEDEDLCRRARLAGRRVLIDGGAVADHVGGASSPDEAAMEGQRLFSTWRLFDKWEGRRAAEAYHLGVLWAFQMRAAAASLSPPTRRTIEGTARLFDEAVQSGADPLKRPTSARGRAEDGR